MGHVGECTSLRGEIDAPLPEHVNVESRIYPYDSLPPELDTRPSPDNVLVEVPTYMTDWEITGMEIRPFPPSNRDSHHAVSGPPF